MTVRTADEIKGNVVYYYLKGVKVSQLAETYSLSQRTVGRILDEAGFRTVNRKRLKANSLAYFQTPFPFHKADVQAYQLAIEESDPVKPSFMDKVKAVFIKFLNA
jgi:hypothetical protein